MASLPAWSKYLFVVATATTATFLCLLVMQLLISSELERPPVTEQAKVAAQLELAEPDRDIEELTRQLPDKALPSEPPPEPEGIPIRIQEFDALTKSERPTLPSLGDTLAESQPRFELSPPARDLVPLYMVQPVYPFSAVMKEVEGYVIVNFGVRSNGTVSNPVVVESEPGELFDDAALSAIDKFRFRPRTLHGDPLAVENLQMRFVFELSADGSGTSIQPLARADAALP